MIVHSISSCKRENSLIIVGVITLFLINIYRLDSFSDFQNYTVHVVPRLDSAFTGLVHSLSTCILLQFFSRSVNIESNFWKNHFFQKTGENYLINFPLSVGRIENFRSCFWALTNFTQTKDWMNKITHPILNWLEKM